MAVSKRTRIIIGVVAVLVIGGVVAFSVTKDRRNKIPVQTQKVARRDLVSTVSASGEIKPKKFVNVAADVSGRITELNVKEGDTVRRGQMLARIDATRLEAGKEQSEAGGAGGARRPHARAKRTSRTRGSASSGRRRCARTSSSPTRSSSRRTPTSR